MNTSPNINIKIIYKIKLQSFHNNYNYFIFCLFFIKLSIDIKNIILFSIILIFYYSRSQYLKISFFNY